MAALVDLAAMTLVALPSYRLDVLLFVTGLVLSFSRQPGVLAFWRQRARAMMPNLRPSRLVAGLLAAPALVVVIWSIWYGTPVAGASAWGATVPLFAGVPALWFLAASVSHLTRTSGVLTWIGERSLSLLVVQDFLRLGTGTAIALWGRPDAITWYAMPMYLAAAIALTPLWHRVPEAVTSRFFRRPAAQAPAAPSRP